MLRGEAAHRYGLHLQDDAASGCGGYRRSVRITSDDPAVRQRPPLTKRLRPKQWAALDYLAGALTTVILFVTVRRGMIREGVANAFSFPHYWPVSLAGPLAVLVVLAAGFAVALRRRRPVFMLGVLLVGSFIVSTLTVPNNNAGALFYFVAVAYVLYLVAATYEEKRDAVRVLVAVFVTLVAAATVLVDGGQGTFNGSALIPVVLCVIIAWTIGNSVRQRRRYAVRLQDEAASKAVAQERLRIARELHDVVAHSMSVIAVQAGYGQYVIDSQPGDARDALGAIQTTSREALDEMRRMLGALRHADEGDAREAGAHTASGGSAAGPGAGAGGPGAGLVGGSSAGAPLFPAPGLADLDRLISRTASAGVQVEVKRAGQLRDLPASIDLSAYRIVQEALTNVVKHAQTSSCQVLIVYGYDLLTIEVTDNGAGVPVPELAGAGVSHHASTLLSRNGSAARGVATLDGPGVRPDGSPARHVFGRDAARHGGTGAPGGGAGSFGEGHGIIGMRERVTLLGGDFNAGPLPGYGFRVSARIPLPALPPVPENSA
jgi:signal transduction histidine kinase